MVNALQSNEMERVSEIEKGPIDPHQLLKALSPLLAVDGGLKSIHEVVRLTSLMKDAKKLVSRCVYVNILRSTKDQNILEKFIEVGGWEVLNSWLVEAKKTDNYPFLLEMLRVFKDLPVSVNILKQNNSAKVIKTLSRGENDDVKLLAGEVVCSWMSLIKYNQKLSEKPLKKKKNKEFQNEKDLKEDIKDEKENPEENFETDESSVTSDFLKFPEKKEKSGRPKTVKVYQSKSRNLGLDQEAHKPIKKLATIDKDRGDNLKRISTGLNKLNQPPEKKVKPANLIMPGTLASSPSSSTSPVNTQRGIKLIPPKPRPVHIISESTGFMSALDAPAAAPVRKKKKIPVKSTAATTPPPTVTPKLLFYTDTLDSVAEPDVKEEPLLLPSEDKNEICEAKEEKIEDGEAKDFIPEKSEPVEEKKEGIETAPILSDLRKKKKKSVSWASEANLRQFYYFDLDETERVNVNHVTNFGDLKTLEMRRERQAFETAKRLMEDKMIERLPWSNPPLIDLPTSLVEPGINSIEKDIQHEREQRVLQEIFFSKESLPDSPHEPDLESIDPDDPKLIPLEDENNPDAYVVADPYPEPSGVSSLPPALANLVMSISNQQQQIVTMPSPQDLSNIQNVLGVIMGQNAEHMVENHMENHPEEFQKLKQILEPFQGPPPMDDAMNYHGCSLPGKGLLGAAPPGFKPLPSSMPPVPYPQGPPPPPPPLPPPPPPPEMMIEEMPPNFSGPRMRHPGPMRPRMMRGRGRHMMMRARTRKRGGSERHVCKYFTSPAGCRFDENCIYIHPGINGPPL